MANPRLKRQQSTISIYFEALSPRYFCCFGVCHAKSAHYNAQEWASREVLIQVAAAILSILLCAATTGCLFVGVVYEKSAFILPYTLRQVVSIVLVYVLIALRPEYTCPGVPISVFLLVLLLVSLGTYRYLADMENAGCRFFISEQMASSRTWSHSSPSRLFSHRSCPSATTPKLSKDANRPATIDFC
ncbi:hypothetical protein M3Y99_00185900 [Aphelenchoides fujianensis]|nr:hypothetical protein M3Y99_00185900 [Aphelenchoides fujianensis]